MILEVTFKISSMCIGKISKKVRLSYVGMWSASVANLACNHEREKQKKGV